MKTKTIIRTASNSLASGENNGRGKRLVPEKKQKNIKRAFSQEIEEDDEIDYLNFKRNDDSIENYYDDDDDEYLDEEDFEGDEEDFDDDDFEEEDDDDE